LQWHEGAIPISAEGFVRPARELALSAESAGRLIQLHPAVQSRASVSKGAIIGRLDDRAAKAALQRASSDIGSTRARLDLNRTQLERAQTLRARGVISEDELDRRLAEESELKASLASLTSALESASVALDSTVIKAPFDGQVLEKHVEVGTVLAPGQIVATLFTPDALEVSVALEESEAALVPALLGPDADFSSIQATVTASFAGEETVWPARIERVAPALSVATRTLEVTVRLNNSPDVSELAPVLVNGWAKVRIEGLISDSVLAVPSAQIRPESTLWLVADGKLNIVDVSTLQVDQRISYVRLDESSLRAPLNRSQLVTSVLPAPVDGMSVRIVDSKGEPADRTAAQAKVVQR